MTEQPQKKATDATAQEKWSGHLASFLLNVAILIAMIFVVWSIGIAIG